MSQVVVEDAKSLDLQKLLSALAAAARAVQGLPSTKEDYDYEVSFPEFGGKPLLTTKSIWLEIVQSILGCPGLLGKVTSDIDILDYDSMEDPLLWDECADMCEMLLEQLIESGSSNSADGVNSSGVCSSLQQAIEAARTKATSQWSRMHNLLIADLPKPQLVYHHLVPPVPDNSRIIPFVPIIHPEKPFGIYPLPLIDNEEEFLPNPQFKLRLKPGHGLENRFGMIRTNSMASSVPNDVVAPTEHCPHLYEKEIYEFQYTEKQMQVAEEIDLECPIPAVSSLECVWVESVVRLEEVVHVISSENVTEVAVDLEAHSYRSFAGLVCLMQLTFRRSEGSNNYNYLIDTLVIERREINRVLAPVFANPSIVKVMHGADHDILWLQRDFGIYVVNLFDTGRAARILSFPSAAYAFLLKRYCSNDIVIDKSYQLADWRQRPLTNAMRQYAIQDTHYLLDIYDRLKMELFKRGGTEMIKEVWDASRQVCLIRYTSEPFKPSGYKVLIRGSKSNRGSKRFGNRTELSYKQEQVLRELWDWRDQIARKHDESSQFVCANHALLRLAMACPTSTSQLQSLFNPLPTLLTQYSQEIITLIKQTTAQAELQQEDEHANEDVDDVDLEDDDGNDDDINTNNTNMKNVDRFIDNDDDDDDEEFDKERSSINQVSASASSAFFKPANIREQEQARRKGMMSPVLGTEALYKQAGWMTPQERQTQSGITAELEQAATSSGDNTDEDITVGGKAKQLLSVHSSNKDYRSHQYSTHSLQVGQRLDRSASDSTVEPRRTSCVNGMGTVRAASEGSISVNQDTNPTDETEAKKMATDNASRIDSTLKSSVPVVFGLVTCTPDETVANAVAVVDDDDGSDDGIISDKATTSVRENEVGVEPEHFFPIPRTIREIYQISNRNRRNKKAGSPTLDRGSIPMSDKDREDLMRAEALLKERGLMDKDGNSYLFGTAEVPSSPGKRPRAKSGRESEESEPDVALNAAAREDDLEFMKEIGWIKNDEDIDSILNQRNTKSRASDSNDTESQSIGVGKEGRSEVKHGSLLVTLDAGSQADDCATCVKSTTPPVGLIQPDNALPSNNPFFAGASLVGGPLTQQGISKPEPRRVVQSGTTNWRQNRSRQPERPEKRGDRTFSYRDK